MRKKKKISFTPFSYCNYASILLSTLSFLPYIVYSTIHTYIFAAQKYTKKCNTCIVLSFLFLVLLVLGYLSYSQRL